MGRHHRGVRADRAVAVQHQALRDPARARRGHALPERLHVPLPRRRDRPEGDRGPDPRVRRTGRVLLRQLGPAVRGLGAEGPRAHRRARDDQLLAAAGARGHGGHHRRPRHRQRARPAVHLPPAGRPDPEAVAAPLRVPQPGLRRLPGLLRLLQAAVPVHPGPGDRQDGGRHPGRPVPAGRGDQEAGPARGRARDRRPVLRRRPGRAGAGRAARRPAGRQVAGRLGGGQAALVQLLGRHHLLPQRQGVAGVPGHPARLPARLHRQGAARRDAGAADGGRHRRARPDRGRVHRADRQRRGPGHVPGQAGAGPHGVPVRGEPQLLRRALGPLGDLAEDARPRAGAGRRGVLR